MNKKLHLTFLLFVFSLSTIFGQDFLKEFGKISINEIELKEYSKDKDAEAVVLFDIGKSYFLPKESSLDLVFERATRIKILSEAGIKYAEVEIPFYQEGNIYEQVYDIEAYAYNYENASIKKIPIDVSNTYDEKVNNYWNVKKFAVPNVKEGTIIEYRYKINSQYKFNLRDWEFQWKIPVVYSEYEVRMVPFYNYTWLLQGAKGFDSQTSNVDKINSHRFASVTYQETISKYIMKDLPAFKNEEFISSINDYIIKIDFQLAKINYPDGTTVEVMTTWEDMNRELLKHKEFGKYAEKSEKLASKILSPETIKAGNEKEKFDQVVEYVKKNYSWDKNYAKYASKTPNKLVEEKFGNSADINLFTVGLLNASGISAKPVLISTRDNGKIIYDYPYAHFFNYIIVLAEVDGAVLLTDATETLSLNNRIPSRCINDKGLVIQKDKVEWVGLECLFPSEIKTDILIEFSSNGTVSADISRNATEYDALDYRNNYADNIEAIRGNLETAGYSIIDTTIKVQNYLDKDKPYILMCKQAGKQEVVNEKIYLSPFLNETLTDNPLKQKERTYPIDMTYPRKRIYYSKIKIPAGYQVDYIPSEQTINNQHFELMYSALVDKDQLVIAFSYCFKKPVYASGDYSKIKFYFNEIVKKGNEKIVFAKALVESN